MSRHEDNEQQIVAERQEEKRGIQHAKDDKSESAEMKQHSDKMAEKDMHA